MRIKPAAVAPALVACDTFGAIAALFINPAHRWRERVPFDPMKAELIKREPGPYAHSFRREPLAPRIRYPDHETAARTPMRPLDLVQRDEADVAELFRHDRPVQVGLRLVAIRSKKASASRRVSPLRWSRDAVMPGSLNHSSAFSR